MSTRQVPDEYWAIPGFDAAAWNAHMDQHEAKVLTEQSIRDRLHDIAQEAAPLMAQLQQLRAESRRIIEEELLPLVPNPMFAQGEVLY